MKNVKNMSNKHMSSILFISSNERESCGSRMNRVRGRMNRGLLRVLCSGTGIDYASSLAMYQLWECYSSTDYCICLQSWLP